MKKCYIFAALTILLSASNLSFAHSNDYGCQKKIKNLQIQLNYAEQYGNVYRAEGLKRALVNVKKNCGKSIYNDNHDIQLNDDIYRQNLNEKIAKQQKKVAKAKRELNEAKATGKTKKIRDKTNKLLDRQEKLDYYLNELKSLKN